MENSVSQILVVISGFQRKQPTHQKPKMHDATERPTWAQPRQIAPPRWRLAAQGDATVHETRAQNDVSKKAPPGVRPQIPITP